MSEGTNPLVVAPTPSPCVRQGSSVGRMRLNYDILLNTLPFLLVQEPKCLHQYVCEPLDRIDALSLMQTCRTLYDAGMPAYLSEAIVIHQYSLKSSIVNLCRFLLRKPRRILYLRHLIFLRCNIWLEASGAAGSLARILSQAHNLQVLTIDPSEVFIKSDHRMFSAISSMENLTSLEVDGAGLSVIRLIKTLRAPLSRMDYGYVRGFLLPYERELEDEDDEDDDDDDDDDDEADGETEDEDEREDEDASGREGENESDSDSGSDDEESGDEDEGEGLHIGEGEDQGEDEDNSGLRASQVQVIPLLAKYSESLTVLGITLPLLRGGLHEWVRFPNVRYLLLDRLTGADLGLLYRFFPNVRGFSFSFGTWHASEDHYQSLRQANQKSVKEGDPVWKDLDELQGHILSVYLLGLGCKVGMWQARGSLRASEKHLFQVSLSDLRPSKLSINLAVGTFNVETELNDLFPITHITHLMIKLDLDGSHNSPDYILRKVVKAISKLELQKIRILVSRYYPPEGEDDDYLELYLKDYFEDYDFAGLSRELAGNVPDLTYVQWNILSPCNGIVIHEGIMVHRDGGDINVRPATDEEGMEEDAVFPSHHYDNVSYFRRSR